MASLRTKEIERETQYDRATERANADEQRARMYAEQAKAFDDIVSAVSAERGGVFFVDGPGGTGKTFLYASLLHYVRGQGHIALATAWSGIAAVLLQGGVERAICGSACPPPCRATQ